MVPTAATRLDADQWNMTHDAQAKNRPCLWFDGQAEDAANFYISIFKNSPVSRYGDAGPGPKGGVMTVAFELDGRSFTGLNGGPMFKFTESISMIVNCETQIEVDHYWEKSSAGGQTQQCGWPKDKFGVSWQIVPTALVELICDKDLAKSQRFMQGMLQMTKIDIARLREAHADRHFDEMKGAPS
jgi:predicted 3-demethylubiquinone-9 3-methyltransferase (glyoxalase superfamily)